METYFAVPMMGSILHTVNLAMAPTDIIYVLGHAEDNAVLLGEEILPYAEALAPQLETVKYIIVSTDKEDLELPDIPGKEVYEYEALIRDYGSDTYEFPELDEDTTATLMYTSGTTGLPKGVYFSHRQILLHTLSLIIQFTYEGFTLAPHDVILHIVPMFHVHAWGGPFASTLMGQKQVLPGRLDFGLILKLIEKEKVTQMAGVPTILYMLLNHPESKNYDLSGIKMIVGGAALPKGLYYEAKKRGMKIIQGYGMTETCPGLTSANLKPGMESLSEEEKDEIFLSAGFPFPLVEIRVVDSEFNDVPKDGQSIGEVVARAPWVAVEYYKDPDKSRETYVQGWFRTGDVAVWFPNGYLKIVDRYKDVIKSGGEWISSIKLEDYISTHRGVAEVAVIGMPDEKWGERPLAIIVPKKEYEDKLSEKDILSHLEQYVEKGVMPKWWLPDKIIFTNELPKTPIGKVSKRELREKYIR
jgi:fatty-acyl-CoA synthase